jgi:nucleotide-binding universal stress UspA family protein
MSSDLDRRHRIVVALDRSAYAGVVLQQALDAATAHAACDLHVLAVQEANAPLDELKTWLAALVAEKIDHLRGASWDWRVRLHVRRGRPVEEIGALASEVGADLIIIGRFGTHRPFRRLGTVAEQVLAAAPCPTLVVQLVDQGVAHAPACPACLAVRRDSDGERWFCAAHSAPERVGMATLLMPLAGSLGGGPRW